MRTPYIVVAVDGGESGLAAARWAAGEARRRDLPLRIVHVLDWEWRTARYDFGGRQFETARRIADNVVRNGARVADIIAPGLSVDTDVPIGNPVAQLIAVSENAGLLVLGCRGLGGFAGLRLGSVSHRVATHATCPVVVIRGDAKPEDAPVAAGVDDSASADTVLQAAFAAAEARRTPLVAVRSYRPEPPLYAGKMPPPGGADPARAAAEQKRLDDQLAPWRTKHPAVAVESRVTHETAAAALTALSELAQLVVVGSHGHGVITGTLLGSTGLQLLHHADCPVLIVRSPGR
ncbi:universal stress protein [Actinoplanes sp. NPDC023714]|uniref:universal stress protein n=1 Tax=Actinoplanes sp. NPDC023714 TaxID=3154322 RepID=UPI0033CFF084